MNVDDMNKKYSRTILTTFTERKTAGPSIALQSTRSKMGIFSFPGTGLIANMVQ